MDTMPLQKVSREEVIARLLNLFRLHGFEGASLTMISEEVGLQKASLYHLFPGGKEEMAKAVLESVWGFFERQVLAPLQAEGDPKARLAEMIVQLREFYGDGRFSCLFDTLSLGGAENPFRKVIAEAMNAWVDALAGVAREHGATAAAARQRAERVVVTVQGALVVARCTADAKVFSRGLRELPGILLPDEV